MRTYKGGLSPEVLVLSNDMKEVKPVGLIDGAISAFGLLATRRPSMATILRCEKSAGGDTEFRQTCTPLLKQRLSRSKAASRV